MDLRQWIIEEHQAIQPLFQLNVSNSVPRDKLAIKPADGSNSIAWLIWHLARIEDVVVNSVVRGEDQVLIRDRWGPRVGVAETQIGTGFSDEEVADFSNRLDTGALIDYWVAVHQETQGWLKDAPLDILDSKPDLRERLESAPEVVSQQGGWVLQLWGGQATSFLLRWTVIGHGYLHLGEMQAVRGQLGIKGL